MVLCFNILQVVSCDVYLDGLNLMLSFHISLHVDVGVIIPFQALVLHTFAHGHTLKN
jgi:hypothetical protein